MWIKKLTSLLLSGSLFFIVTVSPISVNNSNQLQLLTELYRPLHECRPSCVISDLTFHPDGVQIAFIDAPTLNVNGQVIFFDLDSNSRIISEDDTSIQGTRLAFDHIGDRVIIGNEIGEITIYNTETLSPIWIRTVSNGGGVQSVAISPNDDYIAVSTNSTDRIGDHAFYLSRIEDEPILHIPSDEGSLSYGTVFHPINQLVAFAAQFPRQQGYVWLYDLITGQQLASCGNYEPFTDDLVITSDGNQLIYSATDGIRIWNMDDCDTFSNSWTILEPIDDDVHVRALALHPFEPILAVGYRDDRRETGLCCTGIIRLWDINSLELLIELNGFGEQSAITSLAFSPDGTMLASGGADGTVRLWGVPAGE